MAYEHKPGQTAVFTNRDKKSDKHPDFKGKINVLGADLEIAIWDKIDKNGHPYRFVSINEPYRQRTAQQHPSFVTLPISDSPPDDEDVRF